MLFSVIVPIYKVEDHLNKCIQSIISQSFKDYEIILVDDGSPDRCPQICDEWKKRDERIRVIHKKNGGLSDARNAGLDIARGKYIIFIDSDDYWYESDLLEKLYVRQEKFNEDIILFGCKIIKEDGSEEVTRSNYNIELLNNHNKDLSLNDLYNNNNFPGSAWIYTVRRKLVEDNNLRFKVGVTSEDYEWIISTVVAANAIGAVDGVQYAYIRRKGSITTSARYSSILGAVNAFDRYQKLGQRYISIDKFVARIYLLAVMSLSKMTNADQKKSSLLLNKYSRLLLNANQNAYYWFITIFGLRISSFAIRRAYNLVR